MKVSNLSKGEVATILENFLDRKGNAFDWDDFTLGMRFQDKQLEAIRLRCAGLSNEFPPVKPGEYTSQKGREVIREYIAQLRKGD